MQTHPQTDIAKFFNTPIIAHYVGAEKMDPKITVWQVTLPGQTFEHLVEHNAKRAPAQVRIIETA